MKEPEIQRLMNVYGDSLGPVRVPTRVNKRRSYRLQVALAVTTIAVIGFMAWPQNAASAALKRMNHAIQGVRTMEQKQTLQGVDGQWHDFVHTFYKAGMWRFIGRIGTNLESTVVHRDGQDMIEYRNLDHATLEPQGDFSYQGDGSTSPIDFAKMTLEAGNLSEKTTTQVQAHAPVDGRKTYVINIDRPIDSYHCDILVDQATDLPIRADMTVDYRKDGAVNGEVQMLHQEYKFNQPLDDQLFEFTSPKPIVDMGKEQHKLSQLWAKPLASLNRVEIRDATVTQDGNIWIAYTAEGQALPSRLTTDTGATYLRGFDYVPSSMHPTGMKLGKDALVITEFVPLNPFTKMAHQATIGFTFRGYRVPNFAAETPGKAEESAGNDLKLTLTAVPGTYPSYFPAVNLDRSIFELPIAMWELRARRQEADENWIAAAQAYERSAEAYAHFIKYVGFRPLLKAAECYRKAGEPDTAARLEEQAAALKALRER